ncbi:copper resistance protein CopZ [Acuticoccus sediminis]|uniref:Copper resistance protein CopZ n=1 Tax=Acuticoccus sediminis TaxID=2184697 RepID=A0A8B2NRC3_9HYPH|nr:DUF1775 domain-containing protein [Acuticoccus sediminis]RAH99892.1 copper resistance protein CopZ [Acuticoccus sediminis]
MSNTRILGGATALAALLATTLPALSHATFEIGEAPANSTYKAVLRVPHGCDGQPTNTVSVRIPEGFIDVKPMPKAGWTLSTKTSDYARTYDLWGSDVSSGVTEVVWSGGDLPDEYYDEFVFRGRITGFEAGTVLPFKVVQECPDGQVAWVNVAAPGEDAHDIDHPAPTVTIAASDAPAPAHGHGQGHAHGEQAAAVPATLDIETVWMRQPPPGASVAGGYLTVTNTGDTDDTLLGGTIGFARTVEVHEMAVTNGVMTMQEVEGGLVIPAGETVTLAPGGYHLMMLGLSGAPKAGETVPITLRFEHAGPVELMMEVAPIGATKPAGGGHGGMNHGEMKHGEMKHGGMDHEGMNHTAK